MMVIYIYFRRIFNLWFFRISGLLDIIAVIALLSDRTLVLPTWTYWALAALCFIIANIQLFAQLNEKIRGYEAEEASLRINVVKNQAFFEDIVLTKDKRFDDGLNEDGIPLDNKIVAHVEIENIGEKPGVLEWKVDLPNCVLPEFLKFIIGKTDGYFYGQSKEIVGQTRSNDVWQLNLAINESDPVKFAQKLRSSAVYKIILKYNTRRIGSVSEPQAVIISGDFSAYYKKLTSKWKKRNLTELLEILGKPPKLKTL